ncbi:enoyl-CoA hydratase/isomerase family protein [Bacillus marinisedimentorum]|uniref:enoyl-CoA hydratase/isomerase family protein n=1 Tax=Bacillus marinisedimentorum TaxID=1821260 RepID=UPI0008723CDD|nr:enoyl-CoA hydratase/isomerase family protein [Bacillus marinisedimentorum]
MKTIIEKDGRGVLKIVLNRPDKRNAVDFDVMEAISEALDRAETDPDVKMVTLTGTGKAFCSGGDLSVFHELYTKEEAYGMLSKMGSILYRLLTLEKPTAAVIQGTAVGGGCELAAACDFRIAASHVKLGFVQGRLGITTGWGGSTMLFEKLPHAQALEMLSGARLYTAEEAHALGFLQKVSPADGLEKDFIEWSEPILKQSSHVLASYKRYASSKWKSPSFYERFMNEIERCAELWESEEHHEAVARFMNK